MVSNQLLKKSSPTQMSAHSLGETQFRKNQIKNLSGPSNSNDKYLTKMIQNERVISKILST